MRLIVHFYSELTSNYHRVFVNTSFCNHVWNLVVYCCSNMLFIAFYIAAQISISDVHIHLKKITYIPYSIVIVCLLSYIIYSVCCHVYFCCKALTCKLCSDWNSLFVLQTPLRCQVYIPSIIHISKRIYFQLYLSIYTLDGCGTL